MKFQITNHKFQTSLNDQVPNIKLNIRKLLPGLKENVLLAGYTSFRIGGPAKYFFEAESTGDLIKAIKMAGKYNLPFFVLGGGSDLLVSDEGFNGLVIKFQIPMSNVQSPKENLRYPTGQANSKSQCPKIYVETGTLLNQFVDWAKQNSLTGMEWAVGIPGAIGGAIRGNCGAFEHCMADVVKSVKVFELKCEEVEPPKIKILKNKDCQFGYRESIFKHNKNLVILSAEIQLKKGNKKDIQEKIKKYLEYRKKIQPLNLPSAGSIFKNPEGFSAGELIEKCGLKGKRIGNVQISEKHCNFIVNLGDGRAKDVIKLINLAKRKAEAKFKIILEEEIQYLN